MDKVTPFYDIQDSIPVVFCCSNAYVPYVSVTLASLIRHANAQNNYDIVFLHTDFTQENQNLLQEMASDAPHISVRCFDISQHAQIFEELPWVASGQACAQTLYRLLIGELFSKYEKILYLDSDLLILRDVADLFGVALGQNLVGAAVDADHAGAYWGRISDVREYTDDVLQIKRPLEYFQAGVMLLNIPEINAAFHCGEFIEYARKRKYMYDDQDILNVFCQDRVYFIDSRWNVMSSPNRVRMARVIRRAPTYIFEDYLDSRKEPFIIHYAGAIKPWNEGRSDFASFFWGYAPYSPFYSELLARLQNAEREHKKWQYRARCFLRKIFYAICPYGSMPHKMAKTVYIRIFGQNLK